METTDGNLASSASSATQIVDVKILCGPFQLSGVLIP